MYLFVSRLKRTLYGHACHLFIYWTSVSFCNFVLISFMIELDYGEMVQDGRIDYNEFVAMMRRGNADLGKKQLPDNFNIAAGYREAMEVC